MWKGIYDRIVYIIKKSIKIFSKKGFLREGNNVCKGRKNIIFLRSDALN